MKKSLGCLITIPNALFGTAFSEHSSFSEHVLAALKNPLKEELEDFGKNIFLKLQSNRYHS